MDPEITQEPFEFSYTPSDNPYALRIAGQAPFAYADFDTETRPGQWKPANKEALHVEIGCNGGHVLLEWADRNPKDHFIGLDWKFKQVSWAAEKAVRRSISNVAFLRAHAGRMDRVFAPSEIDHLYLFFPDPWPKVRHQKHRLYQTEWLRLVSALVRPGGSFEIRTDHPGYFEQMLQVTDTCADLWEVLEVSHDRHAGNTAVAKLGFPEVTLFERVFIKKGLPVHLLRLKRRAQ